MKRKNILITSVIVILAALASITYMKQSKGTYKQEFAIVDSSRVTKIFLADKTNNSLTLSRSETRSWRINDSILPIRENVDLLLHTMLNIQKKYPVPLKERKTDIKRLATNSTKVEIYGREPLITLFGHAFFVKERLLKVYYVGGPTKNYKGSLVKLEDDEDLFVAYIPGFNGYISERYSARIADWKSHKIFQYLVGEIAELSIDFPQAPHQSYTIMNNDSRNFKLYKTQGGMSLVESYDTIKVLDMLSRYNQINFESLLDNMSKTETDSIKKSIPFRVISIKTTNGESHTLKMYHRKNTYGSLDLNGNPFPWDMDHMYAWLDNDTYLVSMQFFVMDPCTRPLSALQSDTLIRKE